VQEIVPEPEYPDANLLPVPEPLFHEVLYRPAERTAKKTFSNFSLLTPRIQYKEDSPENYDWLSELDPSKVRWIIPAKKTLVLLVKFFTEVTGKFEAKLDFESFFSTKSYSVNVIGLSDFP